jgi:hypothetical protein
LSALPGTLYVLGENVIVPSAIAFNLFKNRVFVPHAPLARNMKFCVRFIFWITYKIFLERKPVREIQLYSITQIHK